MSAATSIAAGAAGRYATALFDLAAESGAIDAVEADIAALGAAVNDSPELATMLASPLYGREEQAAAMNAICGAAGLGPYVTNLVALMAAKRRLFALPQTISQFGRLVAEHRGEVTAEVTSARALSDAQQAALSDKLKAAVGREVKLDMTVDEDLIGGLVVKVGSRMIDTSIRAQLARQCKNVMKEVG